MARRRPVSDCLTFPAAAQISRFITSPPRASRAQSALDCSPAVAADTRTFMKKIALLTVVATITVLGACEREAGTAAPAVEGAPVSTTSEPQVDTEEPAEEPSAEPAVEESDSAETETFTMPNLVGMNLQAAQDELQALGSYVLSQDDATGRGRFQVSDRNWKVCSQDQAPGQVLDIAELVNVEAVKLSESCP